MGVETNTAIVSATQFNRSGMTNSDPGLDDISDSIGLSYISDLILAITETPELIKMKRYAVKQLKNRYNDLNRYPKFLIGVEKSKMRLFDAPMEEQQELIIDRIYEEEDVPIMDDERVGSKFGKEFWANMR